tara:strand:- start:24 stop:497 length:474 start_codon:yes stop_codon:yes gene_type:complete
MPYIGKEPLHGEYIKLDSITAATSTGAGPYDLLRSGAAFSPGTAEQCIVSLNGVTQAPKDAYTITGSTITFSDPLTDNDVINYVLVMGNNLSTGTPSDGSITGTQLAGTLFRDPVRINDDSIDSNITIASTERAMVAGDISVANGVTLTVNGVLTVV